MRAFAGWASLVVCSAAAAFGAEVEQDTVERATVDVGPGRCRGVFVEEQLALTAAHCIPPSETRVTVTVHDGQMVRAAVAEVDRARDVAILHVPTAVPIRPLPIARALPKPNSPVLFTSRDEHAPQLAQVHRLAPCPSLPGVPVALHTTLEGRPGDSGAPVVDLDMRVVGLVHGGAACNIATPSVEFLPALTRAVGETLQCSPK